MLRSGINPELYKVVSSPPEWVNKPDETGYSPYFLTNHEELIRSFLDATTDSVRLVRASRASYEILDEYDMADLEELRATIQASELLRVISYARQTDHSAHTLYLFLLGIYLFFACDPLRKAIAASLKEQDKSPTLVKRFLFQWVFVSLLHDIGYIFQGRSRSEIRAVDRMFRASTIKRLIDSDDDDLKQGAGEFVTELKIEPFEPIQNPEDLLTALRYMPWGEYAEFEKDIFESFALLPGAQNQQISSNYLEDYAYRVASSGYDGFSEGTVDHAVASGLFLLRYSSLWFWLAKKSKYRGPFATYRDGGYPKTDVACACFATAVHNIIGVHAQECAPLELETSPMAYLGILCDELQKWDRFPAGERHLVDLPSFERYCTDSESIQVEGVWDGSQVTFRFEQKELASSIRKALRRLDATEEYVRIYSPDDAEVVTAMKPDQTEESTSSTIQSTTSGEKDLSIAEQKRSQDDTGSDNGA